MLPFVKIIAPLAKVLFVKNMTHEGPAYFSELLDHWKIPFEICDLECGDKLPVVGEQDAVVVLGGSMSANDTTESMLRLLTWTQTLLQKSVPYLGICLGLQTLVKAAGGGVVQSPVKEIGLQNKEKIPYTCVRTSESKKDFLLNGIPDIFPIFQLHGETVVMTAPMTLLASGVFCQNQIVKVSERAYGLQGHLEVTRQTVMAWSREDDDLKKLDSRYLIADFDAVEKDLRLLCRNIFFNFLKISKIVE